MDYIALVELYLCGTSHEYRGGRQAVVLQRLPHVCLCIRLAGEGGRKSNCAHIVGDVFRAHPLCYIHKGCYVSDGSMKHMAAAGVYDILESDGKVLVIGPLEVRTCSLVSGFSDDLTEEDGFGVTAGSAAGALPSRNAFSLAAFSARSFLSACTSALARPVMSVGNYLDLCLDGCSSSLILQFLSLLPLRFLGDLLSLQIFLDLGSILIWSDRLLLIRPQSSSPALLYASTHRWLYSLPDPPSTAWPS